MSLRSRRRLCCRRQGRCHRVSRSEPRARALRRPSCGIRCVPSLADIPEPVDAAFLAIPADAAVQAVRDCARAGLKAAIGSTLPVGNDEVVREAIPSFAPMQAIEDRRADIAKLADPRGVDAAEFAGVNPTSRTGRRARRVALSAHGVRLPTPYAVRGSP